MGKNSWNHTAGASRWRRYSRAKAPRRQSRRCAHTETALDDPDEAAKLRQVEQISEAEIDRTEGGDHQQCFETRTCVRRGKFDRERKYRSQDRHAPKLCKKF